ncbi:hypothetical protein FRX31_020772 [Thalictrum thalictroides]|uniref:Uncharacterized protein n=1 Tax=Thalictrum thalictroides TaxID=46969 RepID=A0A7J6VXT9_THATH|nr:hypothetical protein FRX31_020772 [Thalictrum thalictroides]
MSHQHEVCAICFNPSHPTNLSPSSYPEYFSEQANALNSFRRLGNDPYSNTYNPGWARHPNLSYSQGQHQGGPTVNLPPQPYPRAGNA